MSAQSPTGGNVASGAATIDQSGSTTNVNQTSNSAVINWQSFSVGSGSTVNFNQPTTTSVTLNRVTGDASSVISGIINANGNVFLVNANGILMNSTARISTGGFVASTLDIADSDFNSGNYKFQSGASTPASVVNKGEIASNRSGGFVALLGGAVSNQGTLTANQGTVALAAGDQITLNFSGNALVGVTIGQAALNALVENRQAIYADGGTVILSAKAADDLLSAQVNNSGLIQAQNIGDLKGSILLEADGGTVSVGGTLDASSATNASGGQITTSGSNVRVADGTTVTSHSAAGSDGNWTINSYGFTVSDSGGNMNGTTLDEALNANNVAISSTDASSNGIDSSINLNTGLNWSSNNKLSLSAADYVNVGAALTATGASAGLSVKAGKNIEINAPVSMTGDKASMLLNAGNNIDINNSLTLDGANAALTMNYGGDYNILTPASSAGAVIGDDGTPEAGSGNGKGVYGSVNLNGSNAGLTINGLGYTLIHSLAQLDALDGENAATGEGAASTVTGNYALAADFNAAGTTYAGSLLHSFSGTLAGLGHTISNLNIMSSQSNVGLVGQASYGSLLRDIGLTNVSVASSGENVGALLGNGSATLSNDYSSGQVIGYSSVGGLVGHLYNGTLSHDSSSANVESTESTYYLNGNVQVGGAAGGLIGYQENGTISNSSATGNVTSVNGPVGGLAGYFGGSKIDLSYATGRVTETTFKDADSAFSFAGGLVGRSLGDITNSFAKGNVTGYAQVGGLVGGQGLFSAATDVYTIANSYATGNVTSYGWVDGTQFSVPSGAATGGLVGVAYSTKIVDSTATGNVTSYYNQPYTSGGATNGYVGGLVGLLEYGSVTGSSASGNVAITGSYLYGAGGLVGGSNYSSITDSFAYGNVSGYYYVGGLVGEMLSGTSNNSSITNSAAYGNVTGTYDVGGIVGWAGDYSGGNGANHGDVSNVASYGNVTGTENVGGIAGFDAFGSVNNASSFGAVSGATNVGAIVGDGYSPTVTNSQSHGEVSTEGSMAQQVNQSMTAGAAQTQSARRREKHNEDSAQAAGKLEDLLSNSILVDDPSRFSATVKTVVVDGVEYQVQSDAESDKNKQ